MSYAKKKLRKTYLFVTGIGNITSVTALIFLFGVKTQLETCQILDLQSDCIMEFCSAVRSLLVIIGFLRDF